MACCFLQSCLKEESRPNCPKHHLQRCSVSLRLKVVWGPADNSLNISKISELSNMPVQEIAYLVWLPALQPLNVYIYISIILHKT